MLKNKKLIWIREKLGYTQKQLGELLEVSRVTVNLWESGKSNMPALKLQRLIRTSGVDMSKMPKELDYDAMGYPIGYSKESFLPGGSRCVWFDDGTYDDAQEANVLEKLEGKDYPEREMWRHELFYRDAVASGRFTRETADKNLAEWRDILFGVDDLV